MAKRTTKAKSAPASGRTTASGESVEGSAPETTVLESTTPAKKSSGTGRRQKAPARNTKDANGVDSAETKDEAAPSRSGAKTAAAKKKAGKSAASKVVETTGADAGVKDTARRPGRTSGKSRTATSKATKAAEDSEAAGGTEKKPATTRSGQKKAANENVRKTPAPKKSVKASPSKGTTARSTPSKSSRRASAEAESADKADDRTANKAARQTKDDLQSQRPTAAEAGTPDEAKQSRPSRGRSKESRSDSRGRPKSGSRPSARSAKESLPDSQEAAAPPEEKVPPAKANSNDDTDRKQRRSAAPPRKGQRRPSTEQGRRNRPSAPAQRPAEDRYDRASDDRYDRSSDDRYDRASDDRYDRASDDRYDRGSDTSYDDWYGSGSQLRQTPSNDYDWLRDDRRGQAKREDDWYTDPRHADAGPSGPASGRRGSEGRQRDSRGDGEAGARDSGPDKRRRPDDNRARAHSSDREQRSTRPDQRRDERGQRSAKQSREADDRRHRPSRQDAEHENRRGPDAGQDQGQEPQRQRASRQEREQDDRRGRQSRQEREQDDRRERQDDRRDKSSRQEHEHDDRRGRSPRQERGQDEKKQRPPKKQDTQSDQQRQREAEQERDGGRRQQQSQRKERDDRRSQQKGAKQSDRRRESSGAARNAGPGENDAQQGPSSPKSEARKGAKKDGSDRESDRGNKKRDNKGRKSDKGRESKKKDDGRKGGKQKKGKGGRRAADEPRRPEMPKIGISKFQPERNSRQEYIEALELLPRGIHSDTPLHIRQLVDRIERALIDDLSVSRGDKILLAVSGGVDSIAMLDIINELAFVHDYRLHIAHFNHRLRGKQAQLDAEFVRERAAAYALPCYVGEAPVREYASRAKISIETAARDMRYRFMDQVARKTMVNQVATAHTIDDTAETMLINLFRGSGLTGLSGIPVRRRFNKDANVIRPLFDIRKDDLVAYAEFRGLTWREDDSNSLMLYTRNKIRLDLLPRLQEQFNPAIIEVLNRTARLLRGADRAITQMVEKSVQRIVRTKSHSRIALAISALRIHSNFLQGELLQKIIQKQFRVPPLSIDMVDRIIQLIDAEVGSKVDISGRLFAIRDRDTVIVSEKLPFYHLDMKVEKSKDYHFGARRLQLRELPAAKAQLTDDPNVEYLDSDLLPRTMILRTWKAGDSFQPLGMKGRMKISDFLTNSKVSVLDRQHVVVLATSEDIIWVLGMRLSEKYKLRKQSRNALRIELFRPNVVEKDESPDDTEDDD